jgi:hypothetical protein
MEEESARFSIAHGAWLCSVLPRSRGKLQRLSIQGVWRIAEANIPDQRPEPSCFRSRPNLTIITAKHYSRVEVQADGPRPIPADVAKATADELRAAWGPFVAEAGTYEVTAGNQITMRPIAAKSPAAMVPGAFIAYSYKLEGDTMWLTQQKNQNGPFANPFTLKLKAWNRVA